MTLLRPPRPRRGTRARRPRRALSVVEVLAALVVLGVGLLGVAGASALSLRSATAAGLERRAVRRLAGRHAVLSAGGCARATPGVHEDSAGGVRERWTVGSLAGGVVLIDATARWREGGRPRVLVLRSAILC